MSIPISEQIGSYLESALNNLQISNYGKLKATRMKRFLIDGDVLSDLNCYILQESTTFDNDILISTGEESRKVTTSYLIWCVALQSDKAEECIDTKIHCIAADVMKKLCEDYTLGGIALQSDIVSCEPTDSPEVGVLIKFEVLYSTQWGNPYLA